MSCEVPCMMLARPVRATTIPTCTMDRIGAPVCGRGGGGMGKLVACARGFVRAGSISDPTDNDRLISVGALPTLSVRGLHEICRGLRNWTAEPRSLSAPRHASMRTLSKSDFTLARTCDTKLFFRENGYPDRRDADAYLALLAEGGYMVEALAKAKYQNGIQLEYGGGIEADFERTKRLLEKSAVTLFEATLLVGRRQARVDILEKTGS